MTPQEFAAIRERVERFVAELQADALQAGRHLAPWRCTILDQDLFVSLIGDHELGAIGDDPDERAVAAALVLLGRSLITLSGGTWMDPVAAARPRPPTIAELAACVRPHATGPEGLKRVNEFVVACLLGWGRCSLSDVPSAWRTGARHLVEFLVHSTALARVNWLKQLDEYLRDFDQHPALIGRPGGTAGIVRITQRVVNHLLDDPPCEHWRLNPDVPSSYVLRTVIAIKRGAHEASMWRIAEEIERLPVSGSEAHRDALRQELEKCERQLRQGTFLGGPERAYLACRRLHALERWEPWVTGRGIAARGEREDEEPEQAQEQEQGRAGLVAMPLWSFIIRAASGVASPVEYVMSTALTANVGLANSNKIFRHWERYAQPFAGSLLFHALNTPRETLLWARTLHWLCPKGLCREWRVARCPQPPAPGGCTFAPKPGDVAILRYRFVRADFVEGNPPHFARVRVWVCPKSSEKIPPSHVVPAPAPGHVRGEEPEMEQVKATVGYFQGTPQCPLCHQPHGKRTAEVLVETNSLAEVTCTAVPEDDEQLVDAGEEDEIERDEGFATRDNDDSRPPELPPELSADPAAEDAESSDAEVALAWSGFLATLPPRRRAILELYETDPARFGWLLGRDELGRLYRLRLELATAQDWDAAYAEHCRLVVLSLKTRKILSGPTDPSTPDPDPEPRNALWPDARALAEFWKGEGPEFYHFMNVSLPNLQDERALILGTFKRLHQEKRCSALGLAVARILCARPMAFWWLVFGPAVEDWPRLFDTLQRQATEVCAGLTENALQKTWNVEGRPAALALFED